MTDAAKALAGKYTLSKLNGKEAEKGDFGVPTLKFEEAEGKLKVHAKVANTMNGALNYENGKLTGMLMSTRMMGPPFHMEVEQALSHGFSEGMNASREGDKLTLSHDKNTLEFVVDKNAH